MTVRILWLEIFELMNNLSSPVSMSSSWGNTTGWVKAGSNVQTSLLFSGIFVSCEFQSSLRQKIFALKEKQILMSMFSQKTFNPCIGIYRSFGIVCNGFFWPPCIKKVLQLQRTMWKNHCTQSPYPQWSVSAIV